MPIAQRKGGCRGQACLDPCPRGEAGNGSRRRTRTAARFRLRSSRRRPAGWSRQPGRPGFAARRRRSGLTRCKNAPSWPQRPEPRYSRLRHQPRRLPPPRSPAPPHPRFQPATRLAPDGRAGPWTMSPTARQRPAQQPPLHPSGPWVPPLSAADLAHALVHASGVPELGFSPTFVTYRAFCHSVSAASSPHAGKRGLGHRCALVPAPLGRSGGRRPNSVHWLSEQNCPGAVFGLLVVIGTHPHLWRGLKRYRSYRAQSGVHKLLVSILMPSSGRTGLQRVAAVAVSDSAGDLGLHSDSPAGLLDGQCAGVQSPCGSVVCPTSIR